MYKTILSVLTAIIGGMLGLASAQSFAGTFSTAGGEMSIAIQQGQDGSLTGMITGSTGQYAFQGQASGLLAYGAADSKQGPLGFQAELSGDSQTLQMMFYQADANNQPVPVSPQLVLQRQDGAMGQPPAAGQPPSMGQMPPMGQAPPAVQAPPMMGQAPSMFSPAGPMPQPQVMGTTDWQGTFVGNAGMTSMTVQGGQDGYSGYIQDQGQQYPFQAHPDDAALHGELMVNGYPYEFWAEKSGPTVYLYVGNDMYLLELSGAR